MKESIALIEKYNKSKEVKPPAIAEELSPFFQQLLLALEKSIAKEFPVPQITVEQPDVKVELANPIEVNVPKQEQKAPIITVEAPKVNIPKIEIPAQETAKEWDFEIYRDSRGLINNIKAKRVEEE